ncbi:unnamed protein product [Linum tenue]|uniref:Uncharacterized protein n=1 Tax=Linum tenue TaxID=586396 RepID=A0AAV0H8X0_9ROSI|nr:unnamed protein product [Linum tenue]
MYFAPTLLVSRSCVDDFRICGFEEPRFCPCSGVTPLVCLLLQVDLGEVLSLVPYVLSCGRCPLVGDVLSFLVILPRRKTSHVGRSWCGVFLEIGDAFGGHQAMLGQLM